MKIKDFKDKVHIGTPIRHKGKLYKVEDIIRQLHSVVVKKHKVIRCSEFELAEEGGGQ